MTWEIENEGGYEGWWETNEVQGETESFFGWERIQWAEAPKITLLTVFSSRFSTAWGHTIANATGEVKVDNTAVADSKTLDLVIRPTGLISNDGTIWATWDVVCPARTSQTK